MELRQLKYFVTVGRLGSFSLASKALFITQGTISQQIQKLEEELGVELLTRDTRHVALSDYGEQFYPCAVQVLEEARAGVERIQDVKALKVGTLSIGATYSFGPLFRRTVQDFYKQFPHIRLNLVITSKEELLKKMLDRELDLALTYRPPLGDDRIESHLLFRSRLCLVGRVDELKGAGNEVSVRAVQGPSGAGHPGRRPFRPGCQSRYPPGNQQRTNSAGPGGKYPAADHTLRRIHPSGARLRCRSHRPSRRAHGRLLPLFERFLPQNGRPEVHRTPQGEQLIQQDFPCGTLNNPCGRLEADDPWTGGRVCNLQET